MRTMMLMVVLVALCSFYAGHKVDAQSQSWDSVGVVALDIGAQDTGARAPIYVPSNAKVVQFSCVPKVQSVSGGNALTLVSTCYVLTREPSTFIPK